MLLLYEKPGECLENCNKMKYITENGVITNSKLLLKIILVLSITHTHTHTLWGVVAYCFIC